MIENTGEDIFIKRGVPQTNNGIYRKCQSDAFSEWTKEDRLFAASK